MNVLVIGGGGREHAIILGLSKSKRVKKLFAAPGNGGISKFATCVNIKSCDKEKMIEFAKTNNIDFCVVAPDDPLVDGMVDAFEEVGIKTFGPNKAAAIIEGSKVFSKELMKKYNIPTANYEVFENSNDATEYVRQQNSFPTVIKADGLALGKGVIIAENLSQATEAINSIMNDKIFGNSGNKVVIEEFISGPEVSVLTFCDGKTIKPMISSMDHKKAFDNNVGPNTGGMGTIAPNPHYTAEIASYCMENIFVPTMNAMNSEGRTFKGCLYFGLMITQKGVKVIEYNCRFGDPETQVVLPLLKTDLLDIFEAVYDQKLDKIEIEWENKSAVCVVLASGGYPSSYETGIKINGLDTNGQLDKGFIYHAGTKFEDNNFLTSGGRVLGVVSIDQTLEQAISSSYELVNKISFDKMHFRKDIGKYR